MSLPQVERLPCFSAWPVGSLVALVLVVAGFAVLAVGIHWLVYALADVIAWLVPGSYTDPDVILPRL